MSLVSSIKRRNTLRRNNRTRARMEISLIPEQGIGAGTSAQHRYIKLFSALPHEKSTYAQNVLVATIRDKKAIELKRKRNPGAIRKFIQRVSSTAARVDAKRRNNISRAATEILAAEGGPSIAGRSAYKRARLIRKISKNALVDSDAVHTVAAVRNLKARKLRKKRANRVFDEK